MFSLRSPLYGRFGRLRASGAATMRSMEMRKNIHAAGADAGAGSTAEVARGAAGAQVRPPRVLVVDDEVAIADLVGSLIAAEGMEPCVCYRAADALERAQEQTFDLAILDIMMPGMNGFELCARLRAASDVPIMFLTARDEEADQVAGFSIGADDYVTKPFKPREFMARVKARLRRSAMRASAAEAPPSVLAARDIEVDTASHEARLHGEPLALTPKEFAILAHLVRRAGSPVPTAELFEEAWGAPYDSAASNTVMVHIRHLRQKLAAVDSSTTFVETVWGVGYRLRSDEQVRSGR